MKTWRDKIRPIVADIIAEVGRDDEAKLRRVLKERYPFARRKGWVYKVWLSEIRIQLGKSVYGKRMHQPPPKEQMKFDDIKGIDDDYGRT